VGRPRARPRVDDRPGNGRLVGSLRDARAGRAGGADGADRRADRDRAGETVVLAAAASQRGAVLDRAGVPRRGLEGAVFRRVQEDGRRYKVDEIEAAADAVVWCCDEGPGFTPNRPQDRAFVGNIVMAMQAYAAGDLGEQAIAFADCERIIAIGSDRMMAAVAARATRCWRRG